MRCSYSVFIQICCVWAWGVVLHLRARLVSFSVSLYIVARILSPEKMLTQSNSMYFSCHPVIWTALLTLELRFHAYRTMSTPSWLLLPLHYPLKARRSSRTSVSFHNEVSEKKCMQSIFKKGELTLFHVLSCLSSCILEVSAWNSVPGEAEGAGSLGCQQCPQLKHISWSEIHTARCRLVSLLHYSPVGFLSASPSINSLQPWAIYLKGLLQWQTLQLSTLMPMMTSSVVVPLSCPMNQGLVMEAPPIQSQRKDMVSTNM